MSVLMYESLFFLCLFVTLCSPAAMFFPNPRCQIFKTKYVILTGMYFHHTYLQDS